MLVRAFFDPMGQALNLESWGALYKEYYFRKGPKLGHRIHTGNQTSQYIESEATRILNQAHPLNHQDLKFIYGWKLSQIYHGDSEQKRQVIYKPDWSQHLIAKERFGDKDFSSAISQLTRDMSKIQTLSPQAIFDLHLELDNIGPVYAVTLLFFLSHGQWPIYDRYAAIAVEAITLGLVPPKSEAQASQLSSWRNYDAFVNKISWIFGRQNISREQDQALWAYGHFFGRNNHRRVCR
jgi:hypothetical protein